LRWGLIWVLVVVVMVLSAAALVKYLRSELNRNSVVSRGLLVSDSMRQIAHHRRAPRISAFRRVLTAFLTAIYLIVGFGGEISCAEEALTTGISFDASAVPDKADQDSKKTPTVVDHCYTCAPLTIPAAIQVSEPVAVSVSLSFPSDAMLLIL
jgi:hypothetical protein